MNCRFRAKLNSSLKGARNPLYLSMNFERAILSHAWSDKESREKDLVHRKAKAKFRIFCHTKTLGEE